jgi:hypothetical protein
MSQSDTQRSAKTISRYMSKNVLPVVPGFARLCGLQKQLQGQVMGDAANEFFNAPEYFIEAIKYECAGNGNLRLFVYGRRGGALVPLYSVVAAAPDMIGFANQILEAAAHALSKSSTRPEMTAH